MNDVRIFSDRLAKEVGRLVIAYAFLEHWLDGMVKIAFDHVEGGKALAKKHPVQARNEADFLRKCLTDLALLEAFRDEGISILDRAKDLAEFRADIVHGHLRKINDDDSMEFSRVTQDDQKAIVRKTLTVYIGQIASQTAKIHTLCGIAEKFTHRLIERFGTEEDRQHLTRRIPE